MLRSVGSSGTSYGSAMAAATPHSKLRWTRSAMVSCSLSSSMDATALTTARAGFLKGMWPGSKKLETTGGSTSEDGKPSHSQTPGGGSSSFFPNLDPQKIAMLQDMLSKQSPEKQKELMQQAFKFQQTMTKIPGFKKMAEKQSKMMEEAMKAMPGMMNASATPTASNTAGGEFSSGSSGSKGVRRPSRAAASAISRGGSSGPTLDELKQMNLGDEIEALFEELRVIRHKKNEYRDQCFTMKSQLEDVVAEKARLEKVEQSLRMKLQKSEQEVVLLNSETIDLEDKLKKSNQLKKELEQLQRQYDVLKAQTGDDVVKESPLYQQLAQRLRQKEDALQSLQRKLQRLRRHDPFLQFSLACSELDKIGNLSTPMASTSGSAAAVAGTDRGSADSNSCWRAVHEKYDEASERLRHQYHEHQAKAWTAACAEYHAAAKAYAAFCHKFLMTTLPYANYDAAVTLEVSNASNHKSSNSSGGSEGDPTRSAVDGSDAMVATLEERQKAVEVLFTAFGFEVVPYEEEIGQRVESSPSSSVIRLIIRSPPHGSLTSAGPYAVALAALLCPPPVPHTISEEKRAEPQPSRWSTLRIHSVVPYVSQQLLQNEDRVTIHYDSARASGPGGQAVNVAETQIHAKVELDGEAIFTASAQDSRSAMQNKKAVREKIDHQKRKQFNDTLSAFTPIEAKKKLQERMIQRGGSAVGTSGNAVEVREELVALVEQAAKVGEINALDVSMAHSIKTLISVV